MHGRGVEVQRRVTTSVLKPLVQLITPLPRSPLLLHAPENQQLMSTADEFLLWRLGRERTIRLQATFLQQESDFRLRLEECSITRPEVIVFTRPETIERESIAMLLRLRKQGTHVVYTAHRDEIPGLDRVQSDFLQGQYELTRHLLDQGKLRLLRFRPTSGPAFEVKKEEGFQLALREFPKAKGYTLQAPGEGEGVIREIAGLKQELPQIIKQLAIQVILAQNDGHAALVRTALDLIGRSDIAVTGYDANWREIRWEIFFAGCPQEYLEKLKSWAPPCSVDRRLPDLGQALAEQAVNRALGKLPPEPQTTLIRPKLVP